MYLRHFAFTQCYYTCHFKHLEYFYINNGSFKIINKIMNKP